MAAEINMEYNLYISFVEFCSYYEDDYHLELKENYPDLTMDEYLRSLRVFYFGLWKESRKVSASYKRDFEEKLLTADQYKDLVGITGKNSQQFRNIFSFIDRKIQRNELDIENSGAMANQLRRDILSEINPTAKTKKLSNPKKLALFAAILRNPEKFHNLPDDKQHEAIAQLLDADKTEFVYKNMINLKSKSPSYQIDKYTAFQYVEAMEKYLYDI